MGPANEEFKSFGELAKYFMDAFCHGWSKESSHIIPRIFRYKRAEANDAEFKMAVESDKSNPLVRVRLSDNAELIVFNVLEQLIQEGMGTPFIAVRNLDINKRKNSFTKLFPWLHWNDLKDSLKLRFQAQLAKVPKSISENFQAHLDEIIKQNSWNGFTDTRRLEEIFKKLFEEDVAANMKKEF